MLLSRRKFAALFGFGLLFGTVGCGVTENYPLGKLAVRVLLANDAPVQGVFVDLYKIETGGPIYWRGSTTGTDGVGVLGERDGGVIEGEYFIRVIFNSRHQLAPGETNDRPVTVVEGDDITVTFRAEARGGPPGGI